MKTISVVLLVLLASCGNEYQKADRVALGNTDRAGNDSSSEADSDDTYTKRKNQTDPRKADIPKSNTEKVQKDEFGPKEDSDDSYSRRKNHTAPPVNPEH